jgi:invasion protein IalB
MIGRWGQFMRRNSLTLVTAIGAGLLFGGAAVAQTKKAPAAAKKSGTQVAWVKVCKETEVTHFPKDRKAKPTRVKKMICRTRYEQLAPFAAMSVQIQSIKGVKEQGLIISFSLPQQMAIKPGILAAVYNADQWAKVSKKKKIEKKGLKILKVGYTRCGPGSCSAEVPAPAALIADMRKGKVMLIKAFRGDAQVVEVPVSLAGFGKVLDGKPTDLKAYEAARAKALAALSARRKSILTKERARRAGNKIPEPKAVVKQ